MHQTKWKIKSRGHQTADKIMRACIIFTIKTDSDIGLVTLLHSHTTEIKHSIGGVLTHPPSTQIKWFQLKTEKHRGDGGQNLQQTSALCFFRCNKNARILLDTELLQLQTALHVYLQIEYGSVAVRVCISTLTLCFCWFHSVCLFLCLIIFKSKRFAAIIILFFLISFSHLFLHIPLSFALALSRLLSFSL